MAGLFMDSIQTDLITVLPELVVFTMAMVVLLTGLSAKNKFILYVLRAKFF
jgi:hypothetical protein